MRHHLHGDRLDLVTGENALTAADAAHIRAGPALRGPVDGQRGHRTAHRTLAAIGAFLSVTHRNEVGWRDRACGAVIIDHPEIVATAAAAGAGGLKFRRPDIHHPIDQSCGFGLPLDLDHLVFRHAFEPAPLDHFRRFRPDHRAIQLRLAASSSIIFGGQPALAKRYAEILVPVENDFKFVRR